MNQDDHKETKKPRIQPTASTVLADGTVAEMVYSFVEKQTRFLVSKLGQITSKSMLEHSDGSRMVPYSPHNNLLNHKVVLLPSHTQEYETEKDLLAEVRAFIHRYVDVSETFEEIATYYVLFSWVYDDFNEVPYLRVKGDYGTGKTRFLRTVGSLCYKPIFASGTSTVSSVFRIIDTFKGTLIIDEADFRFSDEKADIIKILNNGNERDFPVLRSQITPTKEFDLRAFHVFGPKIIATRNLFADRALESRCITEDIGLRRFRSDIPYNLPDSFRAEAQCLRNKLLLYRFRNKGTKRDLSAVVDRSVEPRITQVFAPLMSMVNDPEARERLRLMARKYSAALSNERSSRVEAQVLEVICALRKESKLLTMKAIAERFAADTGEEKNTVMNPRLIGSILRNKLGILTYKSNGKFTVPASEYLKLKCLFEKHGIRDIGTSGQNGGVPSKQEDGSENALAADPNNDN